jgi:hypothetical protein
VRRRTSSRWAPTTRRDVARPLPGSEGPGTLGSVMRRTLRNEGD